VSSSSQLSSHRCALPPGSCVSSSAQSRERLVSVSMCLLVLSLSLDPRHRCVHNTSSWPSFLFHVSPGGGRASLGRESVPSTGKSSNSSSSSRGAAGFWSLSGCSVELGVEVDLDASAAGCLEGAEGMVAGMRIRCIGCSEQGFCCCGGCCYSGMWCV
jgi:hypothetical protein